ncbi:hydroxymethylcytosylglucuronate/cytosylglucuronate synthase [Streptomyces sp. NPDC050560]|uniref:hydroxymethylcytosylglucuronate/cytosylglucurona te synthase n=1 Tax=Streptomyces sp. NPDC050560 TaxID=3365630 RepID=UPI00379548FA
MQFGWGSTGKIAAVMDALRARHGDRISFTGLASALGRPVLAAHPVTGWLDVPSDDDDLAELAAAHRFAAAVVVLDPELASRLQSVGVPVVYLDSLPFLWTDHDELPVDVAAYCAQLCPALPRTCWSSLRRIRSLHWVGPVVGGPADGGAAPVPGRAVLNLGGLESPLRDHGDNAYLSLVLSRALTALRDQGFRDVVITGNVDLDRLPRAADVAGISVRGGRLPRGRFLDELRTAELVVTSPGRTTLLEAASLNQRCVVLPPQNLSQIFNAADVATQVDPRIVVGWPADVVDEAVLDERRTHGEAEAVRYLYGRIADAAGRAPAHGDRLAARLGAAIEASARPGARMAPLLGPGAADGAAEVADIVDTVVERNNGNTPGRPALPSAAGASARTHHQPGDAREMETDVYAASR